MRPSPGGHKIKYIPYLPYFYKLLFSQQKVLVVYIEIVLDIVCMLTVLFIYDSADCYQGN